MDKLSEKILKLNPSRQAFRICLYYFFIGIAWVITSDIINIKLRGGDSAEFLVESGKGVLFVILTSVLFFYILRKYFRSLYNTSKELSVNENKFRTLAENLDVGVIRNSIDCKYLFVNDKAKILLEEFLKVTPETDFTGLTPEDIYTDKSISVRVYETIGYITETGKNLALKVRYGNKYLSYSTYPERNSDGEIISILTIVTDETETMNNLIKLEKAEEELTRKSEYLNAVIDVSPMSIFDIDTEGRVLSIWNKASEEIFGWEAEEAIGKLLPTVSPEKLLEFRNNISINISGGTLNGKELIRKKKDGTDVAVKIYSRSVKDNSGKVQSILSYNEDITIQKRFEEGLKKNEEYLKLLYEAGQMANSTFDINELYNKSFEYIAKITSANCIVISSVTEDRKFIKAEAVNISNEIVDASKLPMMKLSPEGKGTQTQAIYTGKAFIENDLDKRFKMSSNNLYIDKEGVIIPEHEEDDEHVSKSAILVPLKHNNDVIGVLQVQSFKKNFYNEEDMHRLEPFANMFSSALQRNKLYRKVQNELFEKEAAYKQLRKFSKGIERSPNSIVITNNNYEIEYVNPYFTEMTGYTFEEVVGKNPNILKSGQTKKDTYEEMWKTLASGETWQGEFLNLKKTGELFWESASIGPITDSTGKITHYIAIKQDITEKKKKDKELKDSLEEKEIMLKEIHHRVKNNLQVVSSLLNMQVEQYSHPEAIEAINSSRNRVKAMALVHENLYKSRNIAKTSLKEYIIMLAKNIYSSYGVSFERVKFHCDTNSIEFGLDTIIPLGLILNEAISNSLKHGFPNEQSGEISIFLDEKANDAGEEMYVMYIKDNGKGLPEGFDPEKTNSLGMTLLTSLSTQLDGNTIINNKVGTEIIINFKELKYKSRV